MSYFIVPSRLMDGGSGHCQGRRDVATLPGLEAQPVLPSRRSIRVDTLCGRRQVYHTWAPSGGWNSRPEYAGLQVGY